jgi:succinoglycan biosynthesis transport protein ExoP
MTQRPSQYIGTDYALEVWQRRKYIAIIAFVVSLAGIVAVTLSLPNLYRATATVLVERQQVSEAFVRPSVTAELETRIQTIDQQVRSRARLSAIITSLGLYPELRGSVPMDDIVAIMNRDIHLGLKGVEQAATGRSATIAFTLSYVGRDPDKVAEVTNMLVDTYIHQNSESRERQSSRTAEFLKQQLTDLKRQVDDEERRSSDFKLRHAGELPEQVEVNLAALERLNTQLRLNSEYQIRAIERRERLQQQLAESEMQTSVGLPSQAPSPAAQLVKLEQELVGLRRKFSDRHPNVIRLRAELDELKATVAGSSGADAAAADLPATPPSVSFTKQALGQSDKEIATLRSEETFLRQVIAGYESRIENAPKRHEELERLSRDFNTSRERYEVLLKRYEEAQLADNLEQGRGVEQFRILDSALPPRRPSAPNRMWLLIRGLAASLAFAFAAIVAAERLDTTFHTVEDLRSYSNLPVVAAVRWIPTQDQARLRRVKVGLVTAGVIAGLGIVAAGGYYVASNNEQIVRMTARGRG